VLEGIRVVMFDWGGTLVRVARQDAVWEACAAAGFDFLRAHGLQPPPDAAADLRGQFVDALHRLEADTELRELETTEFLRVWCGENGVRVPGDSSLVELAGALWRPWIGCLDALEGVPEMLAELADRGYVLGLVSNCAAPPAVARMELQRQGLAGMFAFAVFSSAVGHRKPHERIYADALTQARALAARLQPGQVLFVGDTPLADVVGPQRHGFQTVLLRTGRPDNSIAGSTCTPDLFLDSVDELPAMLP